ncbi:MAG TPA: hypothetical protein VFL57_00455 [Bryobacteraceae bacterium]|nr:hypothetical protein [Bryobacteraceae bacterium]
MIQYLLPVFGLGMWAAAPQLTVRLDPEGGGCRLIVRNDHTVAATAYTVEGESRGERWSETHEQTGAAGGLAPYAEAVVRRVDCSSKPTRTAAVYADGSAIGEPELVTEIIEGRRARLANTRELIRRIESARKQRKSNQQISDEIDRWATTEGHQTYATWEEIRGRMKQKSLDQLLQDLRQRERWLASSKPSLESPRP